MRSLLRYKKIKKILGNALRSLSERTMCVPDSVCDYIAVVRIKVFVFSRCDLHNLILVVYQCPNTMTDKKVLERLPIRLLSKESKLLAVFNLLWPADVFVLPTMIHHSTKRNPWWWSRRTSSRRCSVGQHSVVHGGRRMLHVSFELF